MIEALGILLVKIFLLFTGWIFAGGAGWAVAKDRPTGGIIFSLIFSIFCLAATLFLP